MWRICERGLTLGGKWKMREKKPSNGARKYSSGVDLNNGISLAEIRLIAR